VSVVKTAVSYRDYDAGAYVTRLGPAKTRESEREIPLSPEHAALLNEHAPPGFLIPGAPRSGVPDKRGLSCWFTRLMRLMGYKDVTFHALRHTFATRLLDAGVDIKTVSELLGHQDVGTTMRIYLHPDEASKARAIARLDWGAGR
jgi:integrase